MSIRTFVFDRTSHLNPAPSFPLARIPALDGLRGLLAAGVFLHHAAIYRAYLRDGSWSLPASWLAQLGPLAVALFFMVTGFLFYGRLLAARGRPDWLGLYLGRLFRLGPVYLLAIGALFVTVAVASGGRLRVAPGALAGAVASWLALGAGPAPDLNGLADTRHLMAGVTWTLQSEWLFYAGLPLLAAVVRGGRGLTLALPLGGLALGLAWLCLAGPPSCPACLVPFCAGMLCAARRAGRVALPDRPASAGLALLLALVCGAGLDPRRPPALLLLGMAFYLIVAGGTLFGLLTCPPARWLGRCVYGLYLLHGLSLAWLCALAPVRALALASPAGHWAMVGLAGGLALLLARLAHRLIEAPGIALGRLVAATLRRRLGRFRPAPAHPAQPATLADGTV